MRTRVAVGVALAAVVVLVAASGCAALPDFDGDDDAGPPDASEVRAGLEDVESVTATQVRVVDSPDGTNRTRSVVRLSVPGDGDDGEADARRFRRVLGPERKAGDVVVAAGNETLVYDASESEATRYPRSLSTVEFGERVDFYASLVAAADDGSTVTDERVSPLPVVPAGDGQVVPDGAAEHYEVEYLGTEQVSDRTGHGFRLSAVSDASLTANRTVWLDAERFYPLETTRTVVVDGETYRTRTTLRNATFDAGLSPAAFEWSPPENATVEALGVGDDAYDDRASFAANAPLSVPSADPPDGYRFDRGRVLELDGDDNGTGGDTLVVAEYTDGDGNQLTAEKFQPNASSDAAPIGAGENVTVAGREATFVQTEYATVVEWRCGDVRYTVVGDDVDRDALLAVAESVACQ